MEIRIQLTGTPKYKTVKGVVRTNGCRITFYNQAEGIYYIRCTKPLNLIKIGADFEFNNIRIAK